MISVAARGLSHTKISAVVVGMDLNGLGVARSLGSAGVPVVALETDLSKPEAQTRYARTRRVASLTGAPLIDALQQVRQEFNENPVLLLTQESSVATVSTKRAQLEGIYRFSMPAQETMDTLMDKVAFQALAHSKGFLVPRGARINRDGGEATLGGLRFPCIFKPASKYAEYGRRFAKAYRVSSPDEAIAFWTRVREVAPEVIVQEWIEGDDSDVYFCLQYRPRTGSPLSFVGRKLRQWPPLVGGTAACVPASTDIAAELRRETDRFFASVNFLGLCSMEYKRDARDGRFYMVEPTVGRTDYQEEVATLNGVNLPFAAYLGELGLECSQALARAPCGWRDPEADERARATRSVMNRKDLPLRDAYWRAGDPLPYLTKRWGALQQRLARHFGAAAS